ncbi:MAG: cupin domain-containing protein [Candidatus Tectomicrobia bacterium]|uniref:Cupin domain-containing protein n=1 Tax=Tectimicrobiota bacterium TaxID=2528274 RepID=A0A932MML1_UNCTE|nr:cupin domain-containing protein [Candidatus Tectomicrobia bacterium]
MASTANGRRMKEPVPRDGEGRLQVGERIRDLRMAYSLTQEELAHRSNLTKGFISQLERDLTSPSLESLMGILRALDTDIVEFFRGQSEARVAFGPADCTNADTYPDVAAFELMVPGAANCNMEPALVTLDPEQGIEERAHAGEEFGYVLQGKVMVQYGRRQSPVKRGEWFYLVADRSHKVWNPFEERAKLLWISAPPSF